MCFSMVGKVGLEPTRLSAREPKSRTSANSAMSPCGVDNGTRTRNSQLGRLELYQLSYIYIWCPVTGLNRRPHPCKGYALPAELTGHVFSVLAIYDNIISWVRR